VKRAKKDVLHAGRWVDPKDGKAFAATVADLDELARNTNAWIEAGHRVWFPDGHTDSIRADMGEWSNFRVEGDRLVADVTIDDDVAERKLGRTLREVSPAIDAAPVASDGRRFGRTVIHVAATPQPVVTHQGNFVALARAPAQGGSPMANPVPAPDAPPAPAAAPASAPPSPSSVMSQIAALLGLGADADEGSLVEAVRQLKAAAEVAKEAEGMLPKEMAKQAELSRALETKVKSLEGELSRLHSESIEREVTDARDYCLSRGGLVIEKDTETTVRELFAAGQEKAARHILGLQKKQADDAGAARRGRVTLSRPASTADEAKKQAEADEQLMLTAMGVKPGKGN